MCPILTRTMGDVRDDLAKSTGGTAHFVSFSVDPSTDTPQKLNEYMKKNSIDGKNWAFLTGTWPPIKRLIEKGFRLGAPDEPKFHTEKFVLVDQKYRIRGYYSASSSQDMARLRRNIGKLLSEKKLM